MSFREYARRTWLGAEPVEPVEPVEDDRSRDDDALEAEAARKRSQAIVLRAIKEHGVFWPGED